MRRGHSWTEAGRADLQLLSVSDTRCSACTAVCKVTQMPTRVGIIQQLLTTCGAAVPAPLAPAHVLLFASGF